MAVINTEKKKGNKVSTGTQQAAAMTSQANALHQASTQNHATAQNNYASMLSNATSTGNKIPTAANGNTLTGTLTAQQNSLQQANNQNNGNKIPTAANGNIQTGTLTAQQNNGGNQYGSPRPPVTATVQGGGNQYGSPRPPVNYNGNTDNDLASNSTLRPPVSAGTQGQYQYTPQNIDYQYTPQNIDYQYTPQHSGNVSADGSNGLSPATQQMLQQNQNYNQGQRVSDAQQQLDAILNSKPGEYQSRYGDQIDELMGQVTGGRDPFSYNFNEDELFKYYSDLYTQQGRQAAMDTQAQAAALTGGYGNSWAQSAGNQAYQQYLTQLYDRGMDLRDRAYQQYQDEQTDLYNRLGMLQNAENQDYGRYRDTLSDWRNQLEYQTGRADTAYAQDYNEFLNRQNYGMNLANMENQNYWNAMNYLQNQDQFDANMAYNYAGLNQNQDQFNANMAYNYAGLNQNQNQFNANMAYNYAGLNQNQEQFEASQAQNQAQFDANMAYNYAGLNQNQAQFEASQAQNQNQFDANMAYNYAGLNQNQAQFDASQAQNQAQFDANMAYNYAGLNQNQNQFNATQAQNYVLSILANGQMPSAELLEMAGLSQADAQAFIAQTQQPTTGGGSNPSGGQNPQGQQQAQNIMNGVQTILNTMGNTYAAQQALNWWNNWTNKPNYNSPAVG